MNRPGQGQLLRSVGSMPSATNQPRNNGPNGRASATKPGTWATAGMSSQTNTSQPRNENPSSSENWAQATSARSSNQLDFSASSFPSLNNAGMQSQNQSVGSSAWQTGPPQQEQAGRQQLPNSSRNQMTSRSQQPSIRDNFFSPDSFSRNPTSRLDDFPTTEQASQSVIRRSNTVSSDRFQDSMSSRIGPPGLTQRHPNVGDSLLGDMIRSQSPPGMLPGLARSPIGQNINGHSSQDRAQDNLVSQTGRDGLFSQSPGVSQAMPDVFSGRESLEQKDQSLDSVFAGMSERDKWTMPGYHALRNHPNPNLRRLMQGEDLSTLGVNMNQEGPLLPTWAGPFASPSAARPTPLDTDCNIPECYTVKKVAPVQQRISSFMDETLFYIFYTSPKDMIQMEVAQELVNRKWRYHIKERMWLARDESTSSPVILEDKVSEQGYYIWWDWKGWKKVRRMYVLRYEDLDDQFSIGGRPMQAQGGPSGMNGGASFNAVPGLEQLAALGRGF